MVVEIKDKNLYYVGGVVRDEILGIQSFDTDFCYEGNAIEFAKREGFKIIRENFKTTFKELFKGGSADLKLTDPDNVLETELVKRIFADIGEGYIHSSDEQATKKIKEDILKLKQYNL